MDKLSLRACMQLEEHLHRTTWQGLSISVSAHQRVHTAGPLASDCTPGVKHTPPRQALVEIPGAGARKLKTSGCLTQHKWLAQDTLANAYLTFEAHTQDLPTPSRHARKRTRPSKAAQPVVLISMAGGQRQWR